MIGKLVENIKKTNAPVVAGLDPMLSYVPSFITKKAFAEYGETPAGAAEAIWQFNKGIIDAICDLIPAVKPQIAMYEQFGVEGLKAYCRTVDYCRSKGLVIIGDVKRGDIGSTSAAYAVGHLGKVQIGENSCPLFDTDFATVNPYLGTDGVLPFMKTCAAENKGIFVLVKTSNPSSGEFQDRLVLTEAAGEAGASSVYLKEGLEGLLAMPKEERGRFTLRPLYELVGEKVAEWAAEPSLMDPCGYSQVGAVVGATYPEMGRTLRKIMPKSYILVPGYGAQGGKAEDLKDFFNEDGLGAIVNSSRGIICAYQKAPYSSLGEEGFAEASRRATQDMIADINQALGH